VDVELGAGTFGEYWQGADGEAKDDVMARLVAFLKGVGPHQRAHARRAVTAQAATAAKGFAARVRTELGWT
jgi:hypothetical protein